MGKKTKKTKNLIIWRRILNLNSFVPNLLAKFLAKPIPEGSTCFSREVRSGEKAASTANRQDVDRVSGEEGEVQKPGGGPLRKLQHHPKSEVILSSDLKVIFLTELKFKFPKGIVEQKP